LVPFLAFGMLNIPGITRNIMPYSWLYQEDRGYTKKILVASNYSYTFLFKFSLIVGR
jgi:hypothetical protein